MTLDTVLALISLLGQAVVLGLLVSRRIYKTLPFFSFYVLLLILIAAVDTYAGQFYPQSFPRVYLALSILDFACMFCVLVELSMSVLNPIRASLPRWSFLGVGGLLAFLFAGIWPFAIPPGFSSLTPLSQHIIHIDIASSALRIIFFLALTALSQLLSIDWRDRELQIATGLGFYSLVGLSVTLLHMNQGAHPDLAGQYHMLDELAAGSYICSMAYWIVSFAQKAPERREFTPQMQSFLLAMAGTARATRMAMAGSSETASRSKTRR
jgi:hypothetical protein